MMGDQGPQDGQNLPYDALDTAIVLTRYLVLALAFWAGLAALFALVGYLITKFSGA